MRILLRLALFSFILTLLALSCDSGLVKKRPRVYVNEIQKPIRPDSVGPYGVRGDVKRVKDYLWNDLPSGKITDFNERIDMGERAFNSDRLLIMEINNQHTDYYDDYGRRTLSLFTYSSGDVDRTSYFYEILGDECYVTINRKPYDLKEEITRYKEYELENSRIKYEFDKDGYQYGMWVETKEGLEHRYYDKNGELYMQRSYDWEGRQVSFAKKDRDSDFITLVWSINYKQENNTIIKTTTHHQERTVTTSWFLIGQISPFKSEMRDFDGNLLSTTINTIDSFGNVTQVLFNSPSKTVVSRHDYFYDQKGNWVLRVDYKDNSDSELSLIYIREISYYDGYNSKEELGRFLSPFCAIKKGSSGNSYISPVTGYSPIPLASSNLYNGGAGVDDRGSSYSSSTDASNQNRFVTCSHCQVPGNGICKTCDGKGWVYKGYGLDGMSECPNCYTVNGVKTGKCFFCQGTGLR